MAQNLMKALCLASVMAVAVYVCVGQRLSCPGGRYGSFTSWRCGVSRQGENLKMSESWCQLPCTCNSMQPGADSWKEAVEAWVLQPSVGTQLAGLV